MIDTQALKNRILNLAMRGQLTEQMPDDGTANDLYAQIIKKKTSLLKEGKIKKEKPLGDVAGEDIPFDIPENWKWVRLKDICTKIVDGDHNPPAGVPEKTEYLMLSAQNINNDGIVNIENARYLSREVFIEEDKRTRLETGDVLLTIVATLGRSCVYREEYNVCFQRSVCVISTLINPDFLKRYLDCEYIQKLIVDNATGAAQPGFYLNKVERICVPLPPIPVQDRIIKRIEAIFEVLDKINNLQEQYTSNKESLKSKLIDAAIQGKLTEQLPEDGTAEELYRIVQEKKNALIKSKRIKKDKSELEVVEENVPFDIPNNWKWVCWGEIVNIVSARRVHQSDWRKEGVPFYRAREIAKLADNGFVDNDLYISEELYDEFSKSGVPSDGDLMVSAVGTLGKTYVVKESDHFYYKDASVLCFENYAGVDPYYLRYVMNSNMMKTQIDSNSGGTTVDTLTMVRMIKYILPLPPLNEQHRIVEKLDALLSLSA